MLGSQEPCWVPINQKLMKPCKMPESELFEELSLKILALSRAELWWFWCKIVPDFSEFTKFAKISAFSHQNGHISAPEKARTSNKGSLKISDAAYYRSFIGFWFCVTELGFCPPNINAWQCHSFQTYIWHLVKREQNQRVINVFSGPPHSSSNVFFSLISAKNF